MDHIDRKPSVPVRLGQAATSCDDLRYAFRFSHFAIHCGTQLGEGTTKISFSG
jgi:hypothetical protein